MSQLNNIIDNMKLESSVDLEPYRFEINDQTLSYNTQKSSCYIDTDGDLILNFSIDEDDLLDIIDNDTIVAYLENSGYKVEEEE